MDVGNWAATGYRHGQSEDWESRWKDRLGLEGDVVDGTRHLTRIEGACPMCGHTISKSMDSLDDGVVAFAADDEKTPLPDKAKVYLVTCNCVYAHEDAPEGVRGCGAQGTLRVTPLKEGGAMLEYVATSAEERNADEWFEAAAGQRLSRIREMATQWSAMLGVVTGFVAFGAIFDAGDAATVTGTGRWKPYLVLMAIALAAALAAVVYGALAGGLRRFEVLPGDVGGRQKAYFMARKDAQDKLNVSQICSVIAVVTLAAALVVRFW